MMAGAVLLGTVGAFSQSAPICVTHFNNQSDYRWSITNADGRKSTVFVPPHSTAAIGWGTTTAVTIVGEIPSARYIKQFSVQQGNSSVVIQPKGPDQQLQLNQPGSGDITTCSGSC